jgi:hypothetical protein
LSDAVPEFVPIPDSLRGGAPYSKNLWPEPWSQAHKSDPRENAWHK